MLKKHLISFIQLYTKEDISIMSASITFFIMLAMAPLFLLSTSLIQLLWHNAYSVVQIMDYLTPFLPSTIVPILQELLIESQINSHGLSLILGIFLFFIAISKMVSVIKNTIHSLYTVVPIITIRSNIIQQCITIAFICLLSIFIAFISIANIGISLFIDHIRIWIHVPDSAIQVLSIATFLIAISVFIALIIKRSAGVIIPNTILIKGAFCITLLLLIGQIGLTLYFQFAFQSVSGIASTITILLMWLYYNVQVFLFGVVLIKYMLLQHSKKILPAPGFVLYTNKTFSMPTLTSLQKAAVQVKTIRQEITFGLKLYRWYKKIRRS